jgi:hypothetical protein
LAFAKKLAQDGIEAQSLTITPQMRESILKGQHAYADGGSVVNHALMLLSKQGR